MTKNHFIGETDSASDSFIVYQFVDSDGCCDRSVPIIAGRAFDSRGIVTNHCRVYQCALFDSDGCLSSSAVGSSMAALSSAALRWWKDVGDTMAHCFKPDFGQLSELTKRMAEESGESLGYASLNRGIC